MLDLIQGHWKKEIKGHFADQSLFIYGLLLLKELIW